MSDVTTPAAPMPSTPPFFNNSSKAALALFTLAFNATIIAGCILKGDGTNALHTSALAYAYIVNGGILACLGIGSFAPDVVNAFAKR